MLHWFMTAPLPVIFAAGMILGTPVWLLVFAAMGGTRRTPSPYCSPYAHAQQEYERARDAYQRELARRGLP
jgi:hypothetical protein